MRVRVINAYGALKPLEQEMHSHISLENNFLFLHVFSPEADQLISESALLFFRP